MDLDSTPILVFWETTRACLLACRHCRASAVASALPGELSTGEAARLIGDLTGFGPRPPVLVLTGGDPLMRPDLFDLAGRARRAGIPLGLAPSVTPLLDDAAIRRVKDLGVTSVSLSLDGARPATHEGIRGVPGHLRSTLEALRRLVAEGFTVQVNTTVMRDNVEELPDIALLVASLGVRVWEVFFLVRVGRGTEVEDITPEEHEDVAHFLFEASRYGFLVRTVEAPFFRRVVAWRRAAGTGVDPAERFSLGPLYRRLAGSLRRLLGAPASEPRAQSAGTRDGRGILFVAHDGQVYPAGFLPISLGNVRLQSVVDIYRFHPLLRAIRRAEFTGRCGGCEFKDLCGGSRARAYAASGDPLGEDPACAYVPRAPNPGLGGGPGPAGAAGRRPASGGQGGDQAAPGVFARADAVGHADAAVGRPGQGHPGREAPQGPGHAVGVARGVHGEGFPPAQEPDLRRGAPGPHDPPDLLHHPVGEGPVGQGRGLGGGDHRP